MATTPGASRTTSARAPSPVPVNLRDAASAAPNLLRPGVLLRSDAPLDGDGTPTGVAWPPATVLDLRRPRERGAGPHPLAGPGTRIDHLALDEALSPDAQARLRAADLSLVTLYLGLLDGAPRWLPSLVATAATAAAPVLVHCAAGKDRTGVAVAVLLAAAGVPSAAVEADYARTGDVLAPLVRRMREAHPHRPDVPEHLVTAPVEAITAVLDRIGPDACGWCRDQGVPDEDLRAWRDRIRH